MRGNGQSYATDGICHNAEPGTFGHECGKPATWIGIKSGGFKSGFCSSCKESGHEAKSIARWETLEQASAKSLTMAAFDALSLADRRALKDRQDITRISARRSL